MPQIIKAIGAVAQLDEGASCAPISELASAINGMTEPLRAQLTQSIQTFLNVRSKMILIRLTPIKMNEQLYVSKHKLIYSNLLKLSVPPWHELLYN